MFGTLGLRLRKKGELDLKLGLWKTWDLMYHFGEKKTFKNQIIFSQNENNKNLHKQFMLLKSKY